MGAVVDVDEIEERSGEWLETYNLALDQQERVLRRTWRIRVDDALMTAPTVLAQARTFAAVGAPLPNQWDTYVDEVGLEPNVVARRFTMRKEATRFDWTCEVEYGFAVNPTDEPPILRRTSGQTEWAVEVDATGVGIANAAGDPFDPPITVPWGFEILTITKNIQTVDGPNITANYRYRTNSVVFYGYAKGLVWLSDFSDEPAYDRGVHYRKTTWVFHARSPRGNIPDAQAWFARPLNCGFRYRPAAGQPPIAFRDPTGQIVSSPGLLAADGTKLANNGMPTFMSFQVYGQADFNDLGINGATT